MLSFSDYVLAHKEGFIQNSFAATGLNFTLAFRNLKVIGEAATQIPEGVRQTFTDFPWRRLVAKRHRLIMGVWGDISMRLAHYSK